MGAFEQSIEAAVPGGVQPHARSWSRLPRAQLRMIIREMASRGIPVKTIADILDMPRRRLYDEPWVNELEIGHAKAEARIISRLYDLIERGHPAAVIYGCKSILRMPEATDARLAAERSLLPDDQLIEKAGAVMLGIEPNQVEEARELVRQHFEQKTAIAPP